jgi:hypothetical protein
MLTRRPEVEFSSTAMPFQQRLRLYGATTVYNMPTKFQSMILYALLLLFVVGFCIIHRIDFGSPGIILYRYFYNITTPVVSTLKNYYSIHRASWKLEVPTDFFNHFWIQMTVSLLKPPYGGCRSETAVT